MAVLQRSPMQVTVGSAGCNTRSDSNWAPIARRRLEPFLHRRDREAGQTADFSRSFADSLEPSEIDVRAAPTLPQGFERVVERGAAHLADPLTDQRQEAALLISLIGRVALDKA